MRFDFRTDMATIKEQIMSTERGLPSGIQALDEEILGFGKGELATIGGRPGMGKSSLARNIMLNVGHPAGEWGTVLYCTLEMKYDLVVGLAAATLAKINYHTVKGGNATDSILSQLDSARAQLSSYNIIIEDDIYQTPETIRCFVQDVIQTEPIACLIVDYLQLMSLRKQVENRQTEVAEISRELFAIAKEYNIPVIAMSQLSRASTYRDSTRPRMEDLRESGAMEQDSTKVILIHRPSYYNMSIDSNAEDSGEAELVIVKNRNASQKIVRCAFISTWTSFCNLPEEDI